LNPGQQAETDFATGPSALSLRGALNAVGPEARLLLGGVLLVSVGNFMVAPLLALYLHVGLHEDAASIGLVLTVLIAAQQGLPPVTGILADRLGLQKMVVAGLVARSLGFAGFAVGGSLPLLLAWAALSGAGGAAFTPSAKALVALAAHPRRLEAFALRSVAVNVGAAVGPLVGGLFFGHFRLVFFAAVAIYTLFLTALLHRVPTENAGAPGTEPVTRGPVLAPIHDSALLGLTAASVGFWFLYTQFTFTVPLYAADRFGITGLIGVLFALNAILVLLLQYAAVARAAPRLGSWRTLALGALGIGVGFAALAGIPAAASLLVFTVIFSVGELLVVPTLDNLASLLAPPQALASYLGVASAGWAIGGSIGNLLGGALYTLAHEASAYWILWLGDAALGLATALAFLWLGARHADRAD
jgi:DHA1 family multidrug resistance protein-like MFS transporter